MKRMYLGLMTVFLTVSPFAKSWSSNGNEALYLNGKESSSQAKAQVQALTLLQQDMTEKFRQIESELSAGNSERALRLAKGVLDTVKVKTGIDPKNKIREKFLVATKFPTGAKSIDDLNEVQKDLIIRTISNYRGGLYLDIMNLSKRTTLLYIKAFQAQLKKSGGLMEADKAKIINDLLDASLVPMPVEDKSKTTITVFDEDVANEDHTYLFNRELMMFLIQNPDLEMSENEFVTRRENKKTSLIGRSDENSNLGRTAATKPTLMELAHSCLDDANRLSTYSGEANAKKKCFNKFYKKTENITDCYSLANRQSTFKNIDRAKIACFNKFN